MASQTTSEVKTIDRRLDPNPYARVKPHKQFAWATVLGNKAHRATAIAKLLDMQLPNARRHLRWAVFIGAVVVLKRGRYKYYIAKDVWVKWQKELGEGAHLKSAK